MFSDFTLKCIGVFVVYLNIIESYQVDKVVRAFQFALFWHGNFNKMSGCLVGRPTCAPATTRLTSQLVGISTITYKPSPYIGTLFQCSFFSSINYVC